MVWMVPTTVISVFIIGKVTRFFERKVHEKILSKGLKIIPLKHCGKTLFLPLYF